MEGYTIDTYKMGWSISIWKEPNTPFAYCLTAEGPNDTYVDIQMTKDQMTAIRDRINEVLAE